MREPLLLWVMLLQSRLAVQSYFDDGPGGVILSVARQREVEGSAVLAASATILYRRSFDSAARDKAASDFAQDDTFFFLRCS